MELKDCRPVLILPVLSKVYQKLVLQQLGVFVERESVNQFTINTNQAIEKLIPTATFLLKLHDGIKKAMKSSEVTMAIFTDY